MNFDNLAPGKTVQIALNAKLFIAGEVYSIKSLKERKVQISSKSSTGVQNMVNFENLEYSDGKDVVLDYLIPTKTTEIEITLLGKYYSEARKMDL